MSILDLIIDAYGLGITVCTMLTLFVGNLFAFILLFMHHWHQFSYDLIMTMICLQ